MELHLLLIVVAWLGILPILLKVKRKLYGVIIIFLMGIALAVLDQNLALRPVHEVIAKYGTGDPQLIAGMIAETRERTRFKLLIYFVGAGLLWRFIIARRRKQAS